MYLRISYTSAYNNMKLLSSIESGFMHQVRPVPLNHTSDGNPEGRRWQEMKAETGDETMREEEDEKE